MFILSAWILLMVHVCTSNKRSMYIIHLLHGFANIYSVFTYLQILESSAPIIIVASIYRITYSMPFKQLDIQLDVLKTLISIIT